MYIYIYVVVPKPKLATAVKDGLEQLDVVSIHSGDEEMVDATAAQPAEALRRCMQHS